MVCLFLVYHGTTILLLYYLQCSHRCDRLMEKMITGALRRLTAIAHCVLSVYEKNHKYIINTSIVVQRATQVLNDMAMTER